MSSLVMGDWCLVTGGLQLFAGRRLLIDKSVITGSVELSLMMRTAAS
jgi:hypothetical protein